MIRVRFSVGSLAIQLAIHLPRFTMNAIQEIKETYTLEDFKEIANHGCQSGVCSQHIYYGDTIKFFDKYADEVTNYVG